MRAESAVYVHAVVSGLIISCPIRAYNLPTAISVLNVIIVLELYMEPHEPYIYNCHWNSREPLWFQNFNQVSDYSVRSCEQDMKT